MTPQTIHLFDQAMQLSEEERADLAARLLESLDPAEEGDVESAWDQEIRTRIEELDSGSTRAVPWSEARRLIREDGEEHGT